MRRKILFILRILVYKIKLPFDLFVAITSVLIERKGLVTLAFVDRLPDFPQIFNPLLLN